MSTHTLNTIEAGIVVLAFGAAGGVISRAWSRRRFSLFNLLLLTAILAVAFAAHAAIDR